MGEEYYIKLESVETNLIGENGSSLAPALKNEWITANKATSDGKVLLGKLTYENAEKGLQ